MNRARASVPRRLPRRVLPSDRAAARARRRSAARPRRRPNRRDRRVRRRPPRWRQRGTACRATCSPAPRTRLHHACRLRARLPSATAVRPRSAATSRSSPPAAARSKRAKHCSNGALPYLARPAGDRAGAARARVAEPGGCSARARHARKQCGGLPSRPRRPAADRRGRWYTGSRELPGSWSSTTRRTSAARCGWCSKAPATPWSRPAAPKRR